MDFRYETPHITILEVSINVVVQCRHCGELEEFPNGLIYEWDSDFADIEFLKRIETLAEEVCHGPNCDVLWGRE